MTVTDEEPTGALVMTWLGPGHKNRGRCPSCGEDCTRIALVELVYSFEVCTDEASHHLVEQLWHRSCFAGNHLGSEAADGARAVQAALKKGDSTT